ncbi:FYN-binding protein 2 isoform X2 [Hemicordylus capensis]|uniref:FYN-binding protein 2 isoform X2 n=2 Tax=Hemicordylus capensis TaxID=884348 RepID=UPI0023041026|nr:FYN-binding protein 2 isoform X2 [Hemicordylus capensis]
MAMEGATDFKALRAKFQNDSNFSRTLLQSAKKPPTEIIPQHSTDSSFTSTPTSKPLLQVQVPTFEQKAEHINCTLQKSEVVHMKPLVLPRAKLCELPEKGKNEHGKDTDFPGTLGGGIGQAINIPKPHPTSCGPQEGLVSNIHFRHTLHIWESASSLNDQKCSTVPQQCQNRPTALARSRTTNAVVTVENTIKTAENKKALVLAVPRKSQSEPELFPTTSPPVPPRSHMSLEKVAHGATKVTACPPNADDLDRPSKTFQSPNERQHDVEENKFPKPKPLPSIVSLGPPPKKPPRPPKVSISIFQRNSPDAVDDAYMTPETTATEGQSTYEETINYPLQLENRSNSYVQGTTYPSKAEEQEDAKKQRFLIATPSTETEDAKKRGALWEYEMPKQQAQETVKIVGHGGIFAKAKTNGGSRSGNNLPQEKMTEPFHLPRAMSSGNFSDGYVCLEALKVHEEKAALGPRNLPPVYTVEEVYDDVEGIVQLSDTFNSLIPESFSDETYEDVQSEDCNVTKPDNDKVEKLKKFGIFFKKGKLKMKNATLKDNSCNLSSSVPNLDVMAQESMVYDDIDTEQSDTNPSSKSLLKGKKYNVEKNKVTKEEKWFREKFMYEKEINVINTAIVQCSNSLTKRELDLRVSAGEQLEVIDITEGNQLICRNSEGKYGYVLVEHLTFRH